MTAGGDEYRLIGQTEVTSASGVVSVPLSKTDKTIFVEPGDVTGVYFPGVNPVPYDDVKCYVIEKDSFWFKYEPKYVFPGKDFPLRMIPATYKHPCRKYSFKAIIGK